MSYFMSAAETAAIGGAQKGVNGAGEVNSATGTITLRKISFPAIGSPEAKPAAPASSPAAKKTPLPGYNPVARKFMPQSDILVMGVQPWIKANRASARRPGNYRAALAPKPQMAPRPAVAANRNRFAALKIAQPTMQPAPQKKPAVEQLVTLSLKELPYRPQALMRKAVNLGIRAAKSSLSLNLG